MVFGSMAMAIPHPKYRNQKNARVASGKTLYIGQINGNAKLLGNFL
jgi:hypothetical protein